MSKKLVAFFSATGITAVLAKTLSEAVEADLYEIKPDKPYTKADLNWKSKQSRSSIEMSNPLSRPAIVDHGTDIESYGIIFVGFPIWWFVAPTIINTFLESHNFSGKIIIPFATSGESGLGKTVDRLRPSVSNSAIWKEGKVFNRVVTKDDLDAWIDSLNLTSD